MEWFTQAAANAKRIQAERDLARAELQGRSAKQSLSEEQQRLLSNESWSAQKRAEMRALLQAANTPVSETDTIARTLSQLDSAEFPLDTPQGQVINPKLAALIADGRALGPQAQSDDVTVGIPIGTDYQPSGQAAPQFPQNRNLLRDLFSSPMFTQRGYGPDKLREGFSALNDIMVQSTLPSPAGPTKEVFNQRPSPVEADMAPPNQLDALIASLSQSPPAPAPQAMPQSMPNTSLQTPQEDGSFLSKLGKAFQTPYMDELLLQTGLGLAQSQSFGQALAGGVEKGRAKQAEVDAVPETRRKQELALRKFETDLAKTDAETGKLSAETLKLMKELDSGKEGLDENDYGKLFTDMQKHVSSDIFRMAEDSPFKTDNETYARYLTNSGLRPESRRYGPLKAEYADNMADIWQQVDAGKVKQSVLESRLDEFEVAFGPQQTAKLILKLQGK